MMMQADIDTDESIKNVNMDDLKSQSSDEFTPFSNATGKKN
jgi:hypothetical protein